MNRDFARVNVEYKIMKSNKQFVVRAIQTETYRLTIKGVTKVSSCANKTRRTILKETQKWQIK